MSQSNKEKTLQYLDDNKIRYEVMEHNPVFTVEDMDKEGISAKGGVCKNLFLRDAKGKKHYLVVAPEEKRINLSELPSMIGSTKLSFASAERLMKYLGVEQGSVSPLGVLNDENHEVILVFDQELSTSQRMGIHPNDNTATVWMSFKDLKKLISKLGNTILFAKFDK